MLDNIIEFLKNTDELTTANNLLDTFAKYSSKLEEYDHLGRWYMEITNYPLAIKYAEKALINSPSNEQMYSCRANLAKLYNHINDPVASLRYSSINNKLNPDDYDALMEQVFSYFLLNQKDKSELILRELLIQPDLPENLIHRIKFNLGTYDLYKGEFKKGLSGFLLEGKQLGIWKQVTLPFKFWDGGIQPGKIIVIQAEGGIGDELINIRFAKTLTDLGMIPIWYTTRPDLVEIFRRHGIDTRSSLHDVPTDSLWTYSMTLPLFLDLEPKDLWNGQYLSASEEYITKWECISKPVVLNSVSVGIRWTGNPAYEHDLHRSIPLNQLIDILTPLNYSLYSLQRDEGSDEILKYSEVHNLSSKLNSIEDTLAIIHHLDFVITSCTSVAHMAAAMNKKVFILVPITAYYTWASTTDTSSIWYGDNVKVLRQEVHKSWKDPLDQLKNLLSLSV
jgi:hypothetical protein